MAISLFTGTSCGGTKTHMDGMVDDVNRSQKKWGEAE